MVKVPFGVPFAGSDNWDGCIVKPEQECANPKPSSWTKSVVNTVITAKLKNSSSEAAGYLKARVFPGSVMNAMLVYMQKNQADGADAAAAFIKNHKDVWSKWVPAGVASKIKG